MREIKTKSLDIAHAEESVFLMQRLQVIVRQILSNPSGNDWDKLAVIADKCEELLSKTPHSTVVSLWKTAVTAIRLAVRSHECSIAAHRRTADVTELSAGAGILFSEFRTMLPAMSAIPAKLKFISAIEESTHSVNHVRLLEGLEILPLPTIYWNEKNEAFPFQQESSDDKDMHSEPSLVKVVGFIDNSPLCSAQLLRPVTIYSLHFHICGENWPKEADEIRLDLLTTCPRELYSSSVFTLKRPSQLKKYDGELHGQICFPAQQSTLSPDMVFKVRCAFMKDSSEFRSVPVIGHTELKFRITDPEKSLLKSGYKRLDLHVAAQLGKLLEEHPCASDELPDLVPMLEALNSLLGTYAQSGIFKGETRIPESGFRKQVVRDLRLRLGADVQEHCDQAGGEVDIRYRGVIVELKVETSTGDRGKIAAKYSKQLSQYEGVEARQVGIVLVLDLTEKEFSPGDIRNDILLSDVPTHGGSSSSKNYPSKAFVFVLNGNTRNPSSYK